MGLQYLIIGCFFLLNPYFSIIDIIPDFIGCIFLMKGLSKVSKVSVSFEFAYKQFGLLLAISAVRLCCISLITDTKEIWPLIIVLCAGLGEAFLCIRAFNAIFDGLNATSGNRKSFRKLSPVREAAPFTTIGRSIPSAMREG